jgi:hypothetical protein
MSRIPTIGRTILGGVAGVTVFIAGIFFTFAQLCRARRADEGSGRGFGTAARCSSSSRSSSVDASDVSKYTVQRPRHLGEIQRVDEETRVADLPAGAAAHEAPQLPFDSLPSPRRLLL